MWRFIICATLLGLAAAGQSHLFPVAGCWEVVRGHPGQCRQHWGYQLLLDDQAEVPLGSGNQMLFNGRQTNGIRPPTTFQATKSGRSSFETMIPCDGSLVWLLNNHSAHARIGHASHHCSDKDKSFADRPVAAFFPPVTSAQCPMMHLAEPLRSP